MDKSRAFGVGDKISGAEIADVIPFAIGPVGPMERVGELDFRKILLRDITQTAIHRLVQAGLAHHICGQSIGQDIAIADVGPAFLGAACHFVKAIGNLLAVDDRFVRGDRPWRCGPDHDMGAI